MAELFDELLDNSKKKLGIKKGEKEDEEEQENSESGGEGDPREQESPGKYQNNVDTNERKDPTHATPREEKWISIIRNPTHNRSKSRWT